MIIFAICILALVVFSKSFVIFFTQDDFVLIDEFSKGNFISDLSRVFGPPQVSHWRPLHNLYFFVAGNLFNKNYIAYHVLTFIFHICAVLLIYKIALKFIKNSLAAFGSAIVYAIHPAFFVSYFWISGGATVIGSFFLILGFFLYLDRKLKLSTIFYFLSLLASEAMIVGIFIFIFHRLFFNKYQKNNAFLFRTIVLTLTFVVLRFVYFAPIQQAESYNLEAGYKTIISVKYYILNILGFGDINHGLFISLALTVWVATFVFFLKRKTYQQNLCKKISFFSCILLVGLVPFIFLPNHLSPHYMNISLFGFSLLFGGAISKMSKKQAYYFIAVFTILALVTVNKTYENNWVIKRSYIAKAYIKSIESSNLPDESTIVFNDNVISTSLEAYISLGTGRAVDFWFPQRKYKTCFSEFEICGLKP